MSDEQQPLLPAPEVVEPEKLPWGDEARFGEHRTPLVVEAEKPGKKPKLRRDGKPDRRSETSRKNIGKKTLAEEPDRTPDPKRVGFDIHGRFLPGFAPMRTGLPATHNLLRKEVAMRTHNGVALVDWVIKLWMGEVTIDLGRNRKRIPSFEDRRWAVEWLSERGWGKPQVAVDVSGPAVVVIQNAGDVE